MESSGIEQDLKHAYFYFLLCVIIGWGVASDLCLNFKVTWLQHAVDIKKAIWCHQIKKSSLQ